MKLFRNERMKQETGPYGRLLCGMHAELKSGRSQYNEGNTRCLEMGCRCINGLEPTVQLLFEVQGYFRCNIAMIYNSTNKVPFGGPYCD